MMKKILVIIPAYNEEKNIGVVLDDIFHQGIDLDVLVVNDGSKDRTTQAVLKHGAMVAELPINLGIGGARQTGLLYAQENNYDLCLQMDADGQHPAENIKNLIDYSLDNGVVIGSRYVGERRYKGPLMRRLGMVLLSLFLRLVVHQKITDPTSGLRSISGKAISFLAKNYPIDYPEVEPIVYLHWAGFKMKEIPALMKSRQSGQSSIAPFYYMIKVILAILIGFLREKPRMEDK